MIEPGADLHGGHLQHHLPEQLETHILENGIPQFCEITFARMKSGIAVGA